MRTVTWDQILGVAPTASEAEIASAYRRLAKRVHPDAAPAADEPTRRARDAEMARLNHAYRDARRAVALGAALPRASGTRERAALDEIVSSTSTDAIAEPPSDPTVVTARRTKRPWWPSRWARRVATLVVVAALSFVVVLPRSSSAPHAPAVDTCVVWSGTYRPAPCDEPHTGRVVEEVRDASECPSGYSFTPVSTRVFCIDTSE